MQGQEDMGSCRVRHDWRKLRMHFPRPPPVRRRWPRRSKGSLPLHPLSGHQPRVQQASKEELLSARLGQVAPLGARQPPGWLPQGVSHECHWWVMTP